MSEHDFSIEQLLSALQRKGIPLPCELSAFLVLEAVEQALQSDPRGQARAPVPSAGDLRLNEQGLLFIDAACPMGAANEACHALVALLGTLLVRSATGVPPMLLNLAERGPSDGQFSLTRLRDDLEASLVPLNRSAMRRVCGRLLREAQRGTDRSSGAPPPDPHALDREFDEMLGLSTISERPSVTGTKPAFETTQHSDSQPPTRETASSEPTLHASRSVTRGVRGDALDEFEQRSDAGRGGGALLGLGLVLVGAVLVVAYLLFRHAG